MDENVITEGRAASRIGANFGTLAAVLIGLAMIVMLWGMGRNQGTVVQAQPVLPVQPVTDAGGVSTLGAITNNPIMIGQIDRGQAQPAVIPTPTEARMEFVIGDMLSKAYHVGSVIRIDNYQNGALIGSWFLECERVDAGGGYRGGNDTVAVWYELPEWARVRISVEFCGR